MTRHLLKLIWNRKRTNLLVMAEIFFSFLVLFAIVTVGVFYADNYRRPLGFSYDDVWRINVDMKQSGPEGGDPAALAKSRQLLLAVKELPAVTDVAGSFTSPYDHAEWTADYVLDGHAYDYSLNPVTDSFKDVMGLEVLRGRWFSREDDGAAGFEPIVINARFAREVFGDRDPIGGVIPEEKPADGSPPHPDRRVVGVIREFRQFGEFAAPGDYMFLRQRMDVDDPKQHPPRLLLVRVRPGTTAAFEEPLMARLQAIAPEWSFKIESLAERRASDHRDRLAPVMAAGVVSGFLLLMVALGLTGVLWQNVTQRTREIGLRRAKGATAQRIHRQILGEVTVMTSLALALGLVLVIQFPLLDLLGFVSHGVFATSVVLSAVAIYALALACGYYPGRLATRVQPAEALHYE
jgi:putative ABC transport system permease protein